MIKIVIEIEEDKYREALATGWNREYSEDLLPENVGLPAMGDITKDPHGTDILLMVPELDLQDDGVKIERIA